MASPTTRTLENLLANRVDSQMLNEIAHADYGESVFEHLAALRNAITGSFVVPLEWEPIEVLELTRWTEPATKISHEKPEEETKTEHWMRLFCCTVLLKTSAQPENHESFISEDATIIQFTESAIELGESTTEAAIEFLEWLLQTSHLDCPFTPLATSILRFSLKKDQSSRFETCALNNSDKDLVRRLISVSQLSDKWKKLIKRFIVDSNIDPDAVTFANAIIAK